MPPKIEVVKGRYNKVHTWGSGFMGQLGHGDRSSFDWPRNVQALDGVGIIQMAAGPGDHCIGLTGACGTLRSAVVHRAAGDVGYCSGLTSRCCRQGRAMCMHGAAECAGSLAMGHCETRRYLARCSVTQP